MLDAAPLSPQTRLRTPLLAWCSVTLRLHLENRFREYLHHGHWKTLTIRAPPSLPRKPAVKRTSVPLPRVSFSLKKLSDGTAVPATYEMRTLWLSQVMWVAQNHTAECRGRPRTHKNNIL